MTSYFEVLRLWISVSISSFLQDPFLIQLIFANPFLTYFQADQTLPNSLAELCPAILLTSQ